MGWSVSKVFGEKLRLYKWWHDRVLFTNVRNHLKIYFAVWCRNFLKRLTTTECSATFSLSANFIACSCMLSIHAFCHQPAWWHTYIFLHFSPTLLAFTIVKRIPLAKRIGALWRIDFRLYKCKHLAVRYPDWSHMFVYHWSRLDANWSGTFHVGFLDQFLLHFH